MDLSFGELESELRLVEASIAQLSGSDAFVEDLILHHAYRKRLLAARADRAPKHEAAVADLDLWRKLAARSDTRIDADSPL